MFYYRCFSAFLYVLCFVLFFVHCVHCAIIDFDSIRLDGAKLETIFSVLVAMITTSVSKEYNVKWTPEFNLLPVYRKVSVPFGERDHASKIANIRAGTSVFMATAIR